MLVLKVHAYCDRDYQDELTVVENLEDKDKASTSSITIV